MLKYGGEIVVDRMVWIYNLAWAQSEVPEDWRKAIIVSLYKGKGKREENGQEREGKGKGGGREIKKRKGKIKKKE